jgi:hypothetical protein
VDGTYRVVYPGNVMERFNELCFEAEQLGMLPDVLSTGQTIHTQLEVDPTSFGDPCYTLRATQQLVFVHSISPLLVHYAVHSPLRIVIVQSVDWLPNIAP